LEHTERAAWDSVQALRAKIAQAEASLQRFAPVNESWQEIVEALDFARQELKLPGERYAEIARRLAAELVEQRAEQVRLSKENERLRRTAPAPFVERPAFDRDLGGKRDLDLSERLDVPRIVQSVLRRFEERQGDEPARPEQIDLALSAIERKLDELDDGPSSLRAEQAAELAVSALELALLCASRDETPRPIDDD
jgi:hypothetical protein